MSRMVRFSVGALLAAAIAAQTPALRKGVSVQMPVTTSAVAMPDADLADSVVVAVTLRGTVYLEVTAVTPAQLSGQVKAQLTGRTGKRVYLKGDARTPYSVVAEVLDALRAAGVTAPILLTSQRGATNAPYMPPMGLEAPLAPPAPDAAQAVTLKAGSGQASDAELKQHARRGRPVVLQADGTAPFGDVVHAVDVCRAEGAKVFLSMQGK
ncbi:MAG: biopolymer transporter ExbD [Candidatus Solibacter usitatus]|nr:biopolymer transporter ExbD [Candidatus Solibacter usitatus]